MQNSEPEKKEVIDKEKGIIDKEKNKPEVSSGTSTTEKKEGATKKSAETNSGGQLTAERSRSRALKRRPPSPNLPDEVAHICVGAAVHGLESDSKWGCAVHATEHVGRPDHPVGPRHNLHRRRRGHLKTKEASREKQIAEENNKEKTKTRSRISRRRTFFELFAGIAGLTAVVKNLAADKIEILSPGEILNKDFDLN